MNARKVGAGILVLLTLWALWAVFPTRKRQVLRTLKALSRAVEKDGPEGDLAAAAAARKVSSFFAPRCRVEATAYDFQAEVEREEVTRYAFAARGRAARVSLRFYDPVVDFGPEGEAKVRATARLEGEGGGGESFREVHEVRCLLRKGEGGWKIEEASLVEVLRR
ncbi:MAG: hypothetical protein ACP5VN_09615 [Acidobacteriota bacterium]